MRVIELGRRPLNSLQRFRQRRPDAETCDDCGRELPAEHDHFIEPASRRLRCACFSCAGPNGPSRAPEWKLIPKRVIFLEEFTLSDEQWDSLLIPINMAFFFRSSVDDRVRALYPSPAGATESQLRLETWQEIAAVNPLLRELKTDVQAFLVNRIGRGRSSDGAEYYILPIDECFRLVGLIRAHWKGLSGGTQVWREITAFFQEMRRRADSQPGEAPAAEDQT